MKAAMTAVGADEHANRTIEKVLTLVVAYLHPACIHASMSHKVEHIEALKLGVDCEGCRKCSACRCNKRRPEIGCLARGLVSDPTLPPVPH